MKQKQWPVTIDEAVGVVIAAPRDSRERFGLWQPGTQVYTAEADFGHGDRARAVRRDVSARLIRRARSSE